MNIETNKFNADLKNAGKLLVLIAFCLLTAWGVYCTFTKGNFPKEYYMNEAKD